MDARTFSRAMSFGIPDIALECVMGYIDDPRDRDAVSLVCRKWYNVDALTRKHITIALCYSTTPDRLTRRFPRLESLRLKGKPRAAMFNLIPENWGGYVTPWVNEIAGGFNCLKDIHFRRMIASDNDIGVLVRARGHMLLGLRLDRCSGFSTDGLQLIARSCRCLKTLYLEESAIIDKGGNWLHDLALNNSVLETLNFYMTELPVRCEDLELLVKNCSSLVSLKISECDVFDLVGLFGACRSLEEFGGGTFDVNVPLGQYRSVRFPASLCSLGFIYMGIREVPIIFPYAAALKKLDLQYTFLTTDGHCQLIGQCPNLEILEVRNVIGDRGLETVAQRCKKLRRLRVERGEDEQGLEDEQGKVTHRGLSAIAQGCPELVYVAVYVSDITNGALECVGTFCKKLCDFRLVLLDREERITDLPLDNGVRALLTGCPNLERFALYLRPGGLTDTGLSYVGLYSDKIRWMLLGYVGTSDAGLLNFSNGCPSLQKLELRGCCFSERALASAVMQLRALRYFWVQGYNASETGGDLLGMGRPYWNIEFIPRNVDYNEAGQPLEQPAHVLAYYSLAGRRNDCPENVIALHPSQPV